MSMDIRLPNINGRTEAEQMGQIKSYLHQLVQQLNWAFSVLEGNMPQKSDSTEAVSEETYYRIKSMISQSGFILEIQQKLSDLEQRMDALQEFQ